MPSVTLDAGDAAELAEILTFIGEWLARDTRLEASLADQIGHPAYGIQHLRPGPLHLPARRQRRRAGR